MIIRKENVLKIDRFQNLENKFWRYIDVYDKAYVYVLLINDVNIYVGCTVDLDRRLKAHFKRTASYSTKNYKTLKILEIYLFNEIIFHELEIYENIVVIKYANMENYEDVRGGNFISMKLYKIGRAHV